MPLSRRLLLLALVVLALAAPGAIPAAWGSQPVAAPASACRPERYRVRPGDTLFSIAKRFRTTVAALAQANSLDPNGVLEIGVVLEIPRLGCEQKTAAAPAAGSAGATTLVASLRRAVRVPHVSLARTGVVVIDLASGRVVFELHPTRPLEPASTVKLAVAITALQRLGGTFRTQTVALGEGSQIGRTWRGDLVLKGYGDPMLTTLGLKGLARAVRAQGITSVTGSVVGDESYFDGRRTAPGWKPSYANVECPLLSALVVNRGVLDGRAADRPALAAAVLFTRALAKAGVSVAGAPKMGRASPGATLLARRVSPPLTKQLEQMGTWSDNFVAEMMLKQIGARLAGKGTTVAGASTARATLAGDGVPRVGVRLVDGSGLSSLDRLTARSLAAMLATVWREPVLRPLLGTLAVAGSSGTLRRRLLDVRNHALLRGKTGTTSHSSALAGFVGSRFAFAVLSNGSPVDWQAAHLLQDRIARALLAKLA